MPNHSTDSERDGGEHGTCWRCLKPGQLTTVVRERDDGPWYSRLCAECAAEDPRPWWDAEAS